MGRDRKVADAAIVPAGLAAGFQESPVLPRVLPRVCVGPARALYTGPGLDLAPHINLALTIAVAWQQPFALRTWARTGGWSDWRRCEAAVVPSESLHHLQSSGSMAFLYLDPLQDRRSPLSLADLLAGRARLLEAGPAVGIDAAFAAFGLARRVPTDDRIARVVLEIERHPDAFARLRDAAAVAHLSPSRFRARFDREVGLPFRRYRMWRRMAVVMRTLAGGGNLTDAALAAGFASSAHLSSAFRQVFGLPASSLLALGVTIDLSGDAVLPAQWVSARPRAPAAAA
ncbi:transcriptional regulator [Rubrivivax pictus]|uniref:Transcriptional regulator n=1 Tax=Pseudaquabacterium pictum TaxID=2315236 RepID=A0A480B137_9BURK|nr:transcriptional regulator [Rubrivivax pictus]